MGFLQRRFPAEIDAVSSPQVSPRWFEALGKQDRVLRFLELGNAELLFAALCQEDLLPSSCFGFAQKNRLPLVSSRLHHWLRLPHRCPSLRNRVLSLYHVYKFSSFMLTKRSRNLKVLANRVKQARYTVFSSKMHMNPNLRCFSYHPAAEKAHSRKPSFRRIWFSEAQQIIGYE